MRPFLILFLMLVIFGCGKDSPPKEPESALLVFPLKNSECTTGEETNLINTSLVEFRWSAANHADSYELRATNLQTNTTQTINVAATAAKLPLMKGAPYSYSVITRNASTTASVSSETWLFYNAGFQTNYPPFPAAALAPTSGATVAKDINNEVLLNWEGADVENDITEYEVYFSESNPPETLVGSTTATNSQLRVSVAAQTSYYWRIVSKDAVGNTSNSGVFVFKVL
ncbi:hypothetical protein U1E44_10410 [Arenibacter sp. GZD96]|uniref:hypothetical protein n=1 Tax=Aurantibrevibacter litoralis TaxID=3106030 RepID=UPI002AFE4320|nr:hypothetical protein [Arenibacter sp. GZD-96]MEA1786504.1 hypothetical protein [Arenibacter sp. GZD-96]